MSQTVIALDPGTKRVGVAISDPEGKIALPHAVLPQGPQFIDELAKLASERQVSRIVIGLPRRTSGEEGPEAATARQLAADVERKLGIPVSLYDERFTTKAAASELTRANLSVRKQRKVIDKVAATLLLQSYLDSGAGGVAAAQGYDLGAPEAANPPIKRPE